MDNLNEERINEETSEVKTDEVVTDEIKNDEVQTEEVVTEPLYDDEEDSFFGGGDNTYVKKADRYTDVRSSAFTMLIVGTLGIIFVVLSLTRVINLPFNFSTAWLFYIIMSLVFVAFVIGGLFSYVKANRIKEEAEIEDKKIEEIDAWAEEYLSKESIDIGLDLNESVEILYFSRAERIKSKMMHQFEDVDEGLVDLLTESYYTKIYESDSTDENDNN